MSVARTIPSSASGVSSSNGACDPRNDATSTRRVSHRRAPCPPTWAGRATGCTIHPRMKSGLEIAQDAVLRPIADVAADAGILPQELKPFGATRAKVALSILDRLADRPDGKLIITTAITPTKAGEGKTTTSVSLTQGLGVIGRTVVLALREPSMGPVFGIKGGGTGGGYAQVVPMEEINLHFNGDFHAVTAAHNLLAAALDASIFHGNPLEIDPQTITWPRTLDVNDRELRNTVVGLGGKAHGIRARTAS